MVPSNIGRHRCWQDGDVICVYFEGPMTEDDLRVLRASMHETLVELGRCWFLADMTHCTAIDASARRYMVTWSKEKSDRINGTAAFGVSFAMRTIIELALGAIKLLGHQQVVVVLKGDQAAAERWIDEQRSAALAGASA